MVEHPRVQSPVLKTTKQKIIIGIFHGVIVQMKEFHTWYKCHEAVTVSSRIIAVSSNHLLCEERQEVYYLKAEILCQKAWV